MSKSILSIDKELAKKEYAKSPLGQLEKKIGGFWDKINTKRLKISFDGIDRVNEIRTRNEQAVQDYMDMRNDEDRKAIDKILFDSMSEELSVLEESTTNIS